MNDKGILRLTLSTASTLNQLSKSLPFAFASREVYIPLLSGTRFQEEILHVLATWKSTAEALEIPFYRPHDLSLTIDGATPRVGNGSGASQELPSVIRTTCAELVASRRSSARESTRISDALFPTWFIPKDANPVTTLGKPSADVRKLSVPITAMLGIPGSDVVRISQSVCDFSSGANDWVHVVVDARDAPSPAKTSAGYEQYVFDQIGCKLTKTLELIKANVNPLVHPRIMLVVVGYVDVITVAAAIKRVGSRSVTVALPSVKVSALVACVSATNVYLPDALAAQSSFPKLFDQITAGFATHVVVTHSTDVSASQLGRLRFRIDHVNPFADVHVLAQDVFEGPITALLALDRFESAYYTRFRDAQFPHWDADRSDDSVGWKQYVAELEHELTPMSLRFEIAPGMERSRFLHLVGATLTPFAAFTKSLEKHIKGIRLAQALATDKVRAATASRATDSDARPGGARTNQITASADSECGACWSVDARVVFTSEPTCVYHYVSTGSSARMRIDVKRAQPNDDDDSSSAAPSQQPSLEVAITGTDLNAAKVHALLLNCYAQVERSVAPLRTKASISIDEKRAIQQAHVRLLLCVVVLSP